MADTTRVAQTFAGLADTLVEGYDLIEFLHDLCERCTELLTVNEVGVVLADRHNNLRPLASSSERMRLIELIEVQSQDGPCLDAWRGHTSIRADDIVAERERWPTFAPAALEAGFRSAYALPLRLRSDCIGALNLFADHTDAMPDDDQILGQAMADVATIGILHERFARQHEAIGDQLDAALHHRVVLEQAKGVIAEQHGCDVDEAFTLLRDHARADSRFLHDVSLAVVARQLDIAIRTDIPNPAHAIPGNHDAGGPA